MHFSRVLEKYGSEAVGHRPPSHVACTSESMLVVKPAAACRITAATTVQSSRENVRGILKSQSESRTLQAWGND